MKYKMNKWIPVTQRLPEDEGYYLVWDGEERTIEWWNIAFKCFKYEMDSPDDPMPVCWSHLLSIPTKENTI